MGELIVSWSFEKRESTCVAIVSGRWRLSSYVALIPKANQAYFKCCYVADGNFVWLPFHFTSAGMASGPNLKLLISALLLCLFF